MIGSLETWRWAASEDARPLIGRLDDRTPVGTLARLRDRWTPEQIAVASELARARTKLARKFPDASAMVGDVEGAEMATSSRAGSYKAARLADAVGRGATVIDGCCGIGGDSVALTACGLLVTAVDTDERRGWMASHNAGCACVCGDVRTIEIGADALHLDPARRSGGDRTRESERFEPPLEDLIPLLGRYRAGAIKLHPGVDARRLPPGEVEVLSESGTLSQAVLWAGAAATTERRATLLAPDGSVHTLAGMPDRPDECAEIDGWVHTSDPSVERADLMRVLLCGTGLSLVHPGTGLLTGPGRVDSPWLTAFRVIEHRPWNIRAVRALLRSLDAGTITVKCRAGVVDPDRLSRDLSGRGAADLVLFVLPIGERVHAIVTERWAHGNAPPDPKEGPAGR